MSSKYAERFTEICNSCTQKANSLISEYNETLKEYTENLEKIKLELRSNQNHPQSGWFALAL